MRFDDVVRRNTIRFTSGASIPSLYLSTVSISRTGGPPLSGVPSLKLFRRSRCSRRETRSAGSPE